MAPYAPAKVGLAGKEVIGWGFGEGCEAIRCNSVTLRFQFRSTSVPHPLHVGYTCFASAREIPWVRAAALASSARAVTESDYYAYLLLKRDQDVGRPRLMGETKLQSITSGF